MKELPFIIAEYLDVYSYFFCYVFCFMKIGTLIKK